MSTKVFGSFRVGKKLGFWTYELEDDEGIIKGICHLQDLKLDYLGEDHNFFED